MPTPTPTPTTVVNAYWRGNTLTTVHHDGDGQAYLVEHPADHSFFLRTIDAKAKPDSLRMCRDSRFCLGITDEGAWTRIRWRYDRPDPKQPAAHVRVAKFFTDTYKLPTFEADVGPVRRWVVEHESIEIGRPRRCYLDIEADSRVPFSQKTKARILAWVVVGEGDGSDMQAGILDADDDAAERVLLQSLWAALRGYDQVVSWNGDRYDFPMILARSERVGLTGEHRRWLMLDHLQLYRRMSSSAAESGEEKQSMSLEAVSRSVLGRGKHEGMSGAQSWEAWQSNRGLLLDYCAIDTHLMREIEAATGYIELLQTLCEATHTFPDTYGLQPMGQVETFLMRLGHKRGMHFPTRFRAEEYDRFEGAFVMPPTCQGVVTDVHVADFARLYPSIILSWNMSPETYRPEIRLKESDDVRPAYLAHLPLREFPIPPGHAAAALTDAVFANEPRGILSEALDEMLRLRSYWNKAKAAEPPGTDAWKTADRRSSAYKIAANSFYGVVGSPFSRFYMREVAESVAQSGVWLIKSTIAAAKDKGLSVIYGDTDSLFVTGCTREAFGQFVRWCNSDLYPGMLRERGCTRNEVLLDFEKGFDRLVMVSAKRYVARYSHYKGTAARGDSKPEVKGLEWKRGDVSRLTRDLQGEVIRLLMSGETPPLPESFAPLLDAWRTRILEGELELADVMVSKRLAKPLAEYVRRVNKDGSFAKEPPHVRVARGMKAKGQDVGEGTKIEYIVLDGVEMEVIPAAEWTGAVDRFYMWESLIFPPTARLLAAAYPTHDWTTWERVRPVKPRPVKEVTAPVRRRRKAVDAQPTLFVVCGMMVPKGSDDAT